MFGRYRVVVAQQTPGPPARERRASGTSKGSDDGRTEFQRDVDRFVYNRYWLRLAEITQVYSEGGLAGAHTEQPLQHNRMTHSHKVAQVGRRLAQQLVQREGNEPGIATGGLDVDVVEAACLAHDLGHPPFGHIGEAELDSICRELGLSDGFEGNAQTFRILTSLSVHDARQPLFGLDLTCAVLAASTKYPWSRQREKGADGFAQPHWTKYGCYDIDAPAFADLVAPLLPAYEENTLEAQVMDWADDISYAVHDVEDFYKAGLIPLELLRHVDQGGQGRGASPVYVPLGVTEMQDFSVYVNSRLHGKLRNPAKAWEQFRGYAEDFPSGAYVGTRSQDNLMDQLGSRIIGDCIGAASVTADGRLRIDPDVRDMVAVFKQLTWHYVVERAELAAQQAGQRGRLRRVFEHWLERARWAWASGDPDPLTGSPRPLTDQDKWLRRNTLPVRLVEFVSQIHDESERETIEDNGIVRGVVDYVASLREKEVDILARSLI